MVPLGINAKFRARLRAGICRRFVSSCSITCSIDAEVITIGMGILYFVGCLTV